MDKKLLDAAMAGDTAALKDLIAEDPLGLDRALVSCVSETPLHVALMLGHLGFVTELLSRNPELASELDSHRSMPLHVAAAKGRVKSVRELVRVGNETALHLCVGCNRLEGLKVLVEAAGNDDDFVNWKNCDGNTVLHIAMAKKQTEITKFLLFKTGVNLNALNANSATALDILMQSSRDLRDMEIEDSLRGVGA
ncbi:ankyrin repeat-containing protein BDA1-like [Malus sylvestris]|uniref:ankyrin repeat-containing protein BDA1-like n=1 Tax=Malus sylvestris TaxID=3752 RepID=UPI0021AD3A46|nr:ankyrin repeat-containing protein BDA1-like [Malus sylvestris]